ncbi:tyrosine-type recombinase/integrase [Proteus vulgaris]|uniref:tyrosine-type recombinase/integrase n=1 Tax=Proteus vulgaris TaxID=585 RepID=UPI002875DDA4|nr:tyrosine-type recombinase/integrase [Proteus vulgaris]MDS0790419.1 tyrosine-type recombinase/integrase [Proteus vulgaris]
MLTVKQISSFKAKDKPYRVSDGNGLYLFIPVTGVKAWQMRYQFMGKEKIYSLGKLSELSLQEAREKVFELKKELAKGIDINQAKKEESNKDLFVDVFNEWFDYKKDTWSEKYRKELQSMFSSDILPILGNYKMDDIAPTSLLKVIRKFEERGAMERASKARRRCGEVFRYAIITGRAKYNPAPDLADAEKGYRKKHFPFLTKEQIPDFNKSLQSFTGSIVSKLATEFLQYTAVRTKEMRTLLWSDIDFDGKTINIRPEVMKSRKPHIVPMSKQVESLLLKMKSMTGDISDFVFAGRSDKRKPISENSVLMVIKQIGYDGLASGHGFRHQFSTILNEHGFNRDLIERQLAHVDKSTIRGVYNHAEYLDKRREMMQWFADYIDKISL